MTTRRLFVTALTAVALAVGPAAAHGDADLLTTAARAGKFRTLLNALVATGLTRGFQGDHRFTILAPTDEAFDKLPAGTVEKLLKPENRQQLAELLKYHVFPGDVTASSVRAIARKDGEALTAAGRNVRFTIDSNHRLLVNDAVIVQADIRCGNGVIHVIDKVLMPSDDKTTVLDVAAKAGQFKILLECVKAAGLDDVLKGDGPFTVLAPTDAAFEKLPAGTLQPLIQPKNREKLAAILKLHVVPGRVTAKQALAAGSAKTVAGAAVKFEIQDGRLTVNNARVVANDVKADNGIIHVIDAVLLP